MTFRMDFSISAKMLLDFFGESGIVSEGHTGHCLHPENVKSPVRGHGMSFHLSVSLSTSLLLS